MKKLLFIYSFILILLGNLSFAQNSDTKTKPFQKPKEGKALVYFTRPGFAAGMINFRIYDKDKFIGPLSSGQYYLYECEPGEHLFWAASENRDYVEATLEANKVYVICLIPQPGMFVAGVSLEPFDPKDRGHKKTFARFIKNHDALYPTLSVEEDEKRKDNISKALDKYKELKASNSKKIKVLSPDMNFENADKPE